MHVGCTPQVEKEMANDAEAVTPKRCRATAHASYVHVGSVPQVEKEMANDAEAVTPNAIFDESGNFVIYPSMLGIKVPPCSPCCSFLSCGSLFMLAVKSCGLSSSLKTSGWGSLIYVVVQSNLDTSIWSVAQKATHLAKRSLTVCAQIEV